MAVVFFLQGLVDIQHMQDFMKYVSPKWERECLFLEHVAPLDT